MPSMQDIYNAHASNYDELVRHEDYQENLKHFLRTQFNFQGKTVIELGTGTGRLTNFYIDNATRAYCYDKSAHMLSVAKQNLINYAEKITFSCVDSLEMEKINEKADIVIEGWSFGHLAGENRTNIPALASYLDKACQNLLDGAGTIVIIETLGTNIDKAAAPKSHLSEFYSLLEQQHGYTKKILRTDYKFTSNAEAQRIMGYFFGEEMAKNLHFLGEGIVKEYTGVWYKEIEEGNC